MRNLSQEVKEPCDLLFKRAFLQSHGFKPDPSAQDVRDLTVELAEMRVGDLVNRQSEETKASSEWSRSEEGSFNLHEIESQGTDMFKDSDFKSEWTEKL